MNGFSSPNYTQTPNDLFDTYLKDMGYAELKVVLCVLRYTFGYHRTTTELSLARLAQLTGLTERNVLKGAKAAEGHHLIRRVTHPDTRKTTQWEAIIFAEPPQDSDPTTSPKEVELPPLGRQTTSPREGQLGLKKDKESKESSGYPLGAKSTPKAETAKPARKRESAPADARANHPAIRAIIATIGRYPTKDYWDALIEALGECPDRQRLSQCWEAWKKTKYSKVSVAWAVDWYKNGIPAGLNGVKPISAQGVMEKPAPQIAADGGIYV